MTERRAHWLRPNEANRYPRRVVCLDSEANSAHEGRSERQTFRLAVASFDVIDRSTHEPKTTAVESFLDPWALWAAVSDFSRTKERTCVFAHNLGYDLRLTRALEALPELGWELAAFSLDSYRCWSRWRHGSRTLLMVDTLSFVGRGLATIARDIGLPKPLLPARDAPLEAWAHRCEADVRILRELVLRLLRWLELDECGNFRMTGPAQASAAFRHRFLDRRALLVHDDREALAVERRSAWTGRCEVWRHGDVEGPLVEWDYSLAYARLARDALVPARLRGELGALSSRRLDELARSYAVLAEVEVETEAPVVPAEREGRILWPSGCFDSVLWDCELALAREAGARVSVRRAWAYRRAPLLAAWARWVLDTLEGEEATECPIVRAVVKGWSRSLIGRFGLRYPKWEKAGTAPESDLRLLPYVDGDDGTTGVYLRIGRQVLEQSGVEEAPDSAPAVMAYIMALARVRLWEAMRAAGLDEVVYVDTDSLVVTEAGSRRLAPFALTPAGEGLRVKATYPRARLFAPRQVELGGEARMAGVPRSATQAGPRAYRAQVWEGPSEAIRRQRAGEVVVSQRVIRVRAQDQRRRHGARGRTCPFELTAAS